MKFLSRLIDAAGALVIATAILYFWGYIYYGTYTEALGVPFHGIAISPQEYLTASWQAVGWLVLVLILVVLWMPLVGVGIDQVANWVRKRTGQPPLAANERGFGSVPPIVILMLMVSVAVAGMKLMRTQGQEEAARMLKAAPEVKIWKPDGEAIKGRFIYLRNFGSTLLVKEVSPDGSTTLGHRFFKEAAIGSYSLVTTKQGDGP